MVRARDAPQLTSVPTEKFTTGWRETASAREEGWRETVEDDVTELVLERQVTICK